MSTVYPTVLSSTWRLSFPICFGYSHPFRYINEKRSVWSRDKVKKRPSPTRIHHFGQNSVGALCSRSI